MRRINSNHVDDVRFHHGQLLCVSGNFEQDHIGIKVYDTRTWERIRLMQSPCECLYTYPHTLHVGSQHITLACFDTHIIHTMTKQGDHVHSTKCGSGVIEFNFPHLCHNVNDAVLVADFHNHRLQLRRAGEWSRVQLEPQPLRPLDAVYVGGTLFVLCHGSSVYDCRIIKYVPT